MKQPLSDSSILLIVLHPHPYLGGTPHNNVVEMFKDMPFKLYTPQLRGLVAECEIRRLKKQIGQIQHDKCYIVGYSYGSLVASLLAQVIKCDKLLLISIPYSVSFLCTLKTRNIKNFLRSSDIPLKIIHGTKDQFAKSSKIQQNFKNVTVLSNADHFWFHRDTDLLELSWQFLIN